MADVARPIVVFRGPTISEADVLRYVDAVCLPPAVQGSFVAAVQAFDPGAIVLIDGGFQSKPAIKHKEILWAISRGVVVIGAASMGALRAAELSPWMLGVGLIYRWYRRCALAPDDAVAVLHAPEEMGSQALTDAFMDLRMSFRMALRSGAITAEDCCRLTVAARNLNFRDRTMARAVADACRGMPPEAAVALQAKLDGHRVSQKYKDAVEALRTVTCITVSPTMPAQDKIMTRAFIEDIRMAGMTITD
jgi:hypothetical protein